MFNRKVCLALIAVVGCTLALVASPAAPAGGNIVMNPQQESPFACNVKALDTEQRRRWLTLQIKLNGQKQEVRELPDGYEFRFAAEADMIRELAEFMEYERRCCPFFDLELALAREGGPAWLRLRGRTGVKAFIRSEFKLP